MSCRRIVGNPHAFTWASNADATLPGRKRPVCSRPQRVQTHHQSTAVVEVAPDLADIPLRRASHWPLLARCWELRDNLTMYDASHVALAEALDVRLLTADARIARAPGPRCPVEVLR